MGIHAYEVGGSFLTISSNGFPSIQYLILCLETSSSTPITLGVDVLNV
jgi:hypothetical protein